jgi:chromosome segregation ATPase
VELSQRIDATNERLDRTNERLDRLEHRQAEMEVGLATELTAVVGVVKELRDVLLEDGRLREQVTDHERRITALEGPQRPAGH